MFARSGAKYVVLTSKHHEGFCLWPSQEASRDWGRPWNSVEVGPHRDLLGDLSKSVRDKGLKMGFYYSLYEWYNPLYKTDFANFRDEHYLPAIQGCRDTLQAVHHLRGWRVGTYVGGVAFTRTAGLAL